MQINEVYTAFVSWPGGGKRRPILILKNSRDILYVFKITSKYGTKSPKVKKQYYPIQDWRDAGLKKPSFIDVGVVKRLNKRSEIKFKYVGKLTTNDIEGLALFIENRKSEMKN